jgi:hypothetical protein
VCPIPDACLLVMAQRPYPLLGLPETRSLIFLIKKSPDQLEGYLDYLQPSKHDQMYQQQPWKPFNSSNSDPDSDDCCVVVGCDAHPTHHASSESERPCILWRDTIPHRRQHQTNQTTPRNHHRIVQGRWWQNLRRSQRNFPVNAAQETNQDDSGHS